MNMVYSWTGSVKIIPECPITVSLFEDVTGFTHVREFNMDSVGSFLNNF